MMENIFKTGIAQSLTDVMNSRDMRNQLQNELIQRYPTATVLAIKLNIPGPIKNNQYLIDLFRQGYREFRKQLSDNAVQVITEIDWTRDTGRESILVVDSGALALKQIAIEFEDNTNFGRLFDIDVLSLSVGHLSRADLNLPVRCCLICSRQAKECARSRQHSIEELQNKISAIYVAYR